MSSSCPGKSITMNTQEASLGNAYVDQLIEPYTNAMNTIDDLNIFREWITQIVPEDVNRIITNDLDESKHNFVYHLKMQLLGHIAEAKDLPLDRFLDLDASSVSPWDLARYRNEELIRLFGAATNELPVTVVVGDSSYQHMMSEELAVGILLAVNNRAQLFMYNIPISLDIIAENYSDPDFLLPAKALYKVTIATTEYWFTTPDLIQGIKTGADWFGEDPHDMVEELELINDDETTTPITF